MAFQYLTNTPLDEAREQYLGTLRNNGLAPEPETVRTVDACGRVSYRAVYAKICAPHYHACAMDGVALAASLTFGATETTPVELAAGQYIPVDTGDPLPEGCDAVIMAEDIEPLPDGGIRLRAAAAPWQHVRQIGEDICAGEMILPSRTEISPSAVGAMLAASVLECEVCRRPVVGIIPTGDELVEPCSDPGPGDIVEFNSSIFSAMLRGWGALPRCYPIVRDDAEAINAALETALDECDAVILGAGSSAGREDLSAAAIARVGEVLCHGLAIKPGKPAILGLRGRQPILGVPGYPVSGIIVLEELMRPLLGLYTGVTPGGEAQETRARLGRSLVSGLKYREFVRVRLGEVGGELTASPLGRGAGVVSSFMRADAMLEVPQGVEGLEAGAEVTVRLMRPLSELRDGLVVIGSHDPLLDEVTDLLRLSEPPLRMVSSHVGSMGGIMAIRRGEAHAAGVHLLDEHDGGYSESYVSRLFPEGGVRLVECVGRTQGLMLAHGNPLGLAGFADIARPDLRYVNRQKGSGTRILADFLCRKCGVDPGSVYGYGREELTHTSVAAQIACGSADAGMGIYSAAKLYDLDFLPVCTEQYDLLIPDSVWDSPAVRRLIEVLGSPEFRARLERLGGYTLDAPGRVRRHWEAVK